MESRKFILRQTAVVAAGQILCGIAMIGVFALLGKLDSAVLLGGIAGTWIATLNFFLMSLSVVMAADKAEAQDMTGGRKLLQLSYLERMLGLVLVLLLCAKSGEFNLIALVIPLAFTRPILAISESLIQKGGGDA